MRTLIAVAASLIVNFVALGALNWSAEQAQIAPVGEVLVTQLPDTSELQAHAQVTTGYRLAKAL